MGTENEEIALSIGPTARLRGIYDLLDEVVEGLHTTHDLLDVTSAGIRLRFRGDGPR